MGGYPTYTSPETELEYSLYKTEHDFFGRGQIQILVKAPEQEMPDPVRAITSELRQKINEMSPLDHDIANSIDAFGTNEIDTNIQTAYAFTQQLKQLPIIKEAHIDSNEYTDPLRIPIVVGFSNSFQFLDFVHEENLDIRTYFDSLLEPCGIYDCTTLFRYAKNDGALFDLACSHVLTDYEGVTKDRITGEWIPY